jgi:hypothetical protein
MGGLAGHIVRCGASGVRNIDELFFMLWWAWCGSLKKLTWTHYVELVFLHPVQSVGHVVHSCVSGAQNIDTLFSCLVGPAVDSTKSVVGHVMSNLCFYIWVDLWVT